jgi:hypothetical protein
VLRATLDLHSEQDSRTFKSVTEVSSITVDFGRVVGAKKFTYKEVGPRALDIAIVASCLCSDFDVVNKPRVYHKMKHYGGPCSVLVPYISKNLYSFYIFANSNQSTGN